MTFLNKFNIISDTQYVFRINISTSDALSDIIETVNLNLEHLNVSTKLSRAIGILNKVKFKLNLKSLVLVYNYFFYSHLTYCCHICGNTFFSNLNKIYILQKRALKIITNDTNYSTFYIIHKSLQFHDIIKMNTIEFMFRARNNLLPINLQNLYSIKLHNIIIQCTYYIIQNINNTYYFQLSTIYNT